MIINCDENKDQNIWKRVVPHFPMIFPMTVNAAEQAAELPALHLQTLSSIYYKLLTIYLRFSCNDVTFTLAFTGCEFCGRH